MVSEAVVASAGAPVLRCSRHTCDAFDKGSSAADHVIAAIRHEVVTMHNRAADLELCLC